MAMKRSLFTWAIQALLVMPALASALHGCERAPSDGVEWIPIFDGRSLDGWTPKISGEALGFDRRKTFQVHDGILSVNYDNYNEFGNDFGHLFYNTKLSDYRLKFEYRFTGVQAVGGADWAILNSGVMLHAQDPSTMASNQGFPVSVEAQLLAAFDSAPLRTTANICTPGTHVKISGELITDHCINSETQAARVDEWSLFEVDVKGGQSAELFIDGQPALTLTALQLDPDDFDARPLIGDELTLPSGFIALQSESHPVEFRNILLLDRTNK